MPALLSALPLLGTGACIRQDAIIRFPKSVPVFSVDHLVPIHAVFDVVPLLCDTLRLCSRIRGSALLSSDLYPNVDIEYLDCGLPGNTAYSELVCAFWPLEFYLIGGAALCL